MSSATRKGFRPTAGAELAVYAAIFGGGAKAGAIVTAGLTPPSSSLRGLQWKRKMIIQIHLGDKSRDVLDGKGEFRLLLIRIVRELLQTG